MIAQYVLARLGRCRLALAGGRFPDALAEADLAMAYPPNLGEARLAGWIDSDAHFHAGLALRAMAEPGRAQARFEAGAQARFELAGTRYYNDLPPEKAFYGTLCLAALGRGDQARERFLAMAGAASGEAAGTDFFAVSLPDFLVFEPDPERDARARAHFLAGLGRLGLGLAGPAAGELQLALAADPAHGPARVLLRQLESGFWDRFVLPLIPGAR